MIRVAVHDWLVERRWAIDGLVAVVAVLLGIVPAVLGPDHGEVGLRLTAWSVPLTVLASTTLVFRRRIPVAVWVASVSIGLVAMLVDSGPSPAYVPAIVALYTLATMSPLRLTVGAAVVTAVSPGIVIGVLADSNVVDALVYGLTAWCLLAAAAGVAVGSQRAVVAQVYERARLAEATREEEAQRRVAEERLRIARELHDVVAHHVSVVNVQAGVAAHLLRSDPDKAAEALAHVREASQIVLREVPGLLGLLRSDGELERAPAPSLVQVGDLVEAARRSGLEVAWRTTGSPLTLSPGADLAVYRVLQEALTNAARHGRGGAVAALTFEADGVTLEVRNQRPHGVVADDAERHGLVGMRERVAAVGGELTAGPEGERDWVVRMHLPVGDSALSEVP